MERRRCQYPVLVGLLTFCIVNCISVRNKLNSVRLVNIRQIDLHRRYQPEFSVSQNNQRRKWIPPRMPARLPQLSQYQYPVPVDRAEPWSSFPSEKFVPRLPNHYVNLQKDNSYLRKDNPIVTAQPFQSTKNTLKLPFFEQDDANRNAPMTIYRGLKAELIFNTVMHDKKYKMLEPVPGQVIHPPIVPLFKAGPSQRAHWRTSPTQIPKKSLQVHRVSETKKDMIPFYAHEAIHPWMKPAKPIYAQKHVDSYASASNNENILSTTKGPEIVYAISYYNGTNPLKSQYTVQQTATIAPERKITKPLINTQLSEPTRTPSTTPMPSSSDGIPKPIHENLILVTPFSTIESKTTKRSVHYARHAGFKSYSPLPIHTLNKLITKSGPVEFNQFALADRIKKSTNSVHESDHPVHKRGRQINQEIKIVSIVPNFAWVILNNRDNNSIKSC